MKLFVGEQHFSSPVAASKIVNLTADVYHAFYAAAVDDWQPIRDG